MPEFSSNTCSLPLPAICSLPEPTACSLPEPAACTLPASPPLQWEWRTFDYQPQRWSWLLHHVELTPSPEPSSEVFLMTPETADDIRLTRGHLEVKRLVRTSASGLEAWRPVLSETFPLYPATVFELCDSWGVSCPVMLPEMPTSTAFLSWLGRTLPSVRIIAARKVTRRFRVLGCDGEWVTLQSGENRLETLSLAHHDPAVIQGAMLELRLMGAPNINYTKGLKRFLGWHLDSAHCVLAGVS